MAPGIAYGQDQVPPSEEIVAEGTAGGQRDETEGQVIVVTAQKRLEVLTDVPQSVTVVGEATLERHQADNLQDYLALVPGLSLEGSTRGVSRITLRGINTGGVASTVGVYVDEVPFGSSSGLANGAILAGDFDTFDVDRLEVLRGPQGTLYGASSLGGVIKFVTNAPDPRKLEAKAQTSIESLKGGGVGYSVTGLVNVPLSDKAAIRASGFYRKDAGFVDSIGNNPIASLLDPTVLILPGTTVDDDINKLKTYGGRASLLFNATDNFSVRLGAIIQNIDNEASDYFEVDPVTLEPLYGGLVQSRYFPEFTDVKYRIYSGVADWDLGFANLTSSTSYGKFSEDFQRDWSGISLIPGQALAQTITLFFGDAETRPLSAVLNQVTATKKFTQEVRLASPDSERFEWLVGGFYTHEKSGIDPQHVIAMEAASGEPAEDIPLLFEVFLRSKYKEYAAFANGTFHFTPQFDLTVGGRISENKQSASQRIDGLLAGGVTEFDDVSSKESVFTYSVAPRYEINDTTSVYARIASGYRPGGPNVLPPGAPPGTPTSYDSDRLTSYEAGIKADWFNRRLTLDFSAYYLDWKDIQLFAVVNTVGINANGGKAVSKGFEFTATGRPVKGLTVSLNGAYTDAYLTEDTDPVVGGFDGDPLPYIPDWSLNFNADYEWPVWSGANAFVGGSVSYVGDRTPDFGVRDADGDLVDVPSYTTIDLRAGVETDHWLIQAYVRNLTDKRGITSILTLAPGSYPNDAGAIGIVRPRTIGLTLGAKL